MTAAGKVAVFGLLFLVAFRVACSFPFFSFRYVFVLFLLGRGLGRYLRILSYHEPL